VRYQVTDQLDERPSDGGAHYELVFYRYFQNAETAVCKWRAGACIDGAERSFAQKSSCCARKKVFGEGRIFKLL